MKKPTKKPAPKKVAAKKPAGKKAKPAAKKPAKAPLKKAKPPARKPTPTAVAKKKPSAKKPIAKAQRKPAPPKKTTAPKPVQKKPAPKKKVAPRPRKAAPQAAPTGLHFEAPAVRAYEANCDGLVGPTHSYAGLSPGNIASERNRGEASNPRAAVLQGLQKMRRLVDLGIPQFVLPPHERPNIPFLRSLGFTGSDRRVLAAAWKEAPLVAAAACSASSMWAANAATVTPSADAPDGKVHFTPANLVSNLHRSLEGEQTTRALKRLFPNPKRFTVHEALHATAHFGDEGAANHVRLCASHGAPGVNLFVWGREAWVNWVGGFPARQTLEASQAVARRHGAHRSVFARQGMGAIESGAFHNDVVCLGTKTALLFHELAFDDVAGTIDAISRAADGLFEPQFLEIPASLLPIGEAVKSYLFNSQLIEVPGKDRLVLIAPAETLENKWAERVAHAIVSSNGPIGQVEYVDVRQSMRNGGGPACLRLRVVLTEPELEAVNPFQRFTPELHDRLADWAGSWYRDRLFPKDLADPQLLDETRGALDQLTGILNLGTDFYPFQRA